MKRCWFGAGLLLLLLIFGLLTARAMEQFHESLGEELLAAADLAETDPAAAELLAGQAREKWEKRRKFTALLADHAPMDQIREDFSALDSREADFREICLRLASQLDALGKGQQLSWENLF